MQKPVFTTLVCALMVQLATLGPATAGKVLISNRSVTRSLKKARRTNPDFKSWWGRLELQDKLVITATAIGAIGTMALLGLSLVANAHGGRTFDSNSPEPKIGLGVNPSTGKSGYGLQLAPGITMPGASTDF